MKGILGRKVGMTEKFTKDGKVIPVTVVSVEPNVIMQVKTTANDGYEAIQLAFEDKKEQRTTKAAMGHAKKANTAPKRFLKEIRVSDASIYEIGSTINADIFEQGEKVDVQGTSKGKGFTGVIKRWNQAEGPKTHGSRYHRGPGSLGSMRPMRVRPGKRLSGHMGHETTTIQNLSIVEVDTKLGYILVSGNIPGPKKSLVLIKEATKSNEKTTFELVDFNEKVVNETENTEEVINEEVEITTPEEIVEEIAEETATEEAMEDVAEEVAAEEAPAEVVEEPTIEETTEETTEESK